MTRPPEALGLKSLRRLARRRDARAEDGLFVVEGAHPVRAALEARWPLVTVFAEPGADPDLLRDARAAGVAVVDVAAGRLEGVVSTRSPQPVAAVAETVQPGLDDLDPVGGRLLLVLVDVGDPGNVGTLVRIADAVGARAVLCLGETADPFGPKAVRASAGSVFAVDVVIEREAASTVRSLRARGFSCVASAADAPLEHDRADLTGPIALVLGSEAHGVSDEVAAECDQRVRIPMAGRAESLNVAMAGAVLGFESLRQRRRTEEGPSST